MNIFWKILVVFISISTFVLLIYITYLTSSISDNNQPFYEEIKTGTSVVENLGSEWFNINYIGLSNNIVSIKWDYDIENDIIKLNNWLYIFDFREIYKSFTIQWKWFEIENLWPWIFVINSINKNQIKVFSISSIVNVNFTNTKKETNAILYPNMFVNIYPSKNSNIAWADYLKIEQLNELSFFNNKITENWELNNSILNYLWWNDEEVKNKLTQYFNYLEDEYKKSTNKFELLKSSNVLSLPWEDKIIKYLDIFINPNKKSIYIKNNIIKDLISIIDNDNDAINKINSINNNIAELKKIDNTSYENIRKIIDYYYHNAIQSNSNFTNKLNFTNLRYGKTNIFNKSSINIEKAFFDYNFTNKENYYKEIANFKVWYFKELNIDKNISDYKENIDYLFFFLREIITSYKYDNEISNFLLILNDYNDTSKLSIDVNTIKFKKQEINITELNNTKRTIIFENSEILSKTISIIEQFFEEKRDKNDLLILNQNYIISKEDLNLLKTNIEKIFELFYKNEKVLTKKDNIQVKLYEIKQRKINEYLDALTNYKEYLVNYNKSKLEIINADSLWKINNEIVLSKDYVVDFLSTFNWISKNNIDIKIMDYIYCKNPIEENENLEIKTPYCYKIDNLIINSKNISLLLNPYESNKIYEIKINNVENNWSYKLDEIKMDLDEKNKSSTEDKFEYDFNNFLLITLWNIKVDNNDGENIVINEESIEESETVQYLKRNKLFWIEWEFNIVKWFLDISYNDVIVKEVWNYYDITINSVSFSTEIETNWKKESYSWEFNSKYDFTNKHSFINPYIKILDEKNKTDILFGNYIYINWEYKIETVKEDFKNIFYNFSTLENTLKTINKVNWETKIKINYDKTNNYFTVESDINWYKLSIKIKDNYIENVIYNWNNLINNKINYNSLYNILNNLN